MNYAIYIDRERDKNCVLLTDGAFTPYTNCYMREFGVTWHKPVLFKTPRAARAYIRKNLNSTCRGYVARKYAGPTEAWDRTRTADREDV